MMMRWLLQICFTVMALLASASVSSAADCVSDPNECTLKKLCEASTTLDGNNTIWATASETAKHVALAKSLGMECGVTPIVDLCETDPSECKVSEICEKATTESAGQKTWDDSAAGHVALAKEYGLSCDVVVEATRELQRCKYQALIDDKSGLCTDDTICWYATMNNKGTAQPSWNYSLPLAVKEAKNRGLNCGVGKSKTTPAVDECPVLNVGGCTPVAVCDGATYERAGNREWLGDANLYVKEAKKRGLTCGVGEITSSKKTCVGNPENCEDERLCRLGTLGPSNDKRWSEEGKDYAIEAKKRGLTCGVSDSDTSTFSGPCSAQGAAGCTNEELCYYAKSSMQHYAKEINKRGLTCGVETASAQVKSKSVCNLTHQKACRNEKTLCRLATNKGKWETRSGFKQYSKEAKKRGLSCGVGEAKAKSVNKGCYASNVKGCSIKELCKNSTVPNGNTRVWKTYNSVFANEAKKRGLTCGVGETKPAKATTQSSIVLKASKRFCSGNGIGHYCTGVYTNSKGNKWIGRGVNRKLYGVVTYLSLADGQWKGDVRIGQRNNISNNWSGQNLYVWRSGQARFDFDVPKGTYNSNSTVNEVFPQLRRMFNALPKQQRLKIQRSLAKKDLYASTIDGAWGRNTLIGLSRFAAEHLNTINLKSKSNIRLVLDGLIAQASLTRTKMAPLNVLEEVAKKDAGFTRVASNSSSMKNAYIGETALRRKQIQYALKKLGFYTSGVDGLWGNGTASALVSYQNEEGLQSSTPSQVFRRILSEVDVPSSFSAPKKKTTASNNSGEWRPFSANPQYSFNQAKAICEPQAEMAGEQASSSYSSPSYGSSANCTGYGYSINCNVRENSGGFWGGVADGLGKGLAKRNAARAVLKSCMAKYGWTK